MKIDLAEAELAADRKKVVLAELKLRPGKA